MHGLASVDRQVVLAADEQRAQSRRRVAVELRVLALRDGEAETAVERRVRGRQVGAEVAVALLDAERVERLVADGLRRAGGEERIPDRDRAGRAST